MLMNIIYIVWYICRGRCVLPAGSVGAFACCCNQRLPPATRTPHCHVSHCILFLIFQIININKKGAFYCSFFSFLSICCFNIKLIYCESDLSSSSANWRSFTSKSESIVTLILSFNGFILSPNTILAYFRLLYWQVCKSRIKYYLIRAKVSRRILRIRYAWIFFCSAVMLANRKNMNYA